MGVGGGVLFLAVFSPEENSVKTAGILNTTASRRFAGSNEWRLYSRL